MGECEELVSSCNGDREEAVDDDAQRPEPGAGGRHHSGIDNCRNIAKILRTLAARDDGDKLRQALVQPKCYMYIVNTSA